MLLLCFVAARIVTKRRHWVCYVENRLYKSMCLCGNALSEKFELKMHVYLFMQNADFILYIIFTPLQTLFDANDLIDRQIN